MEQHSNARNLSTARLIDHVIRVKADNVDDHITALQVQVQLLNLISFDHRFLIGQSGPMLLYLDGVYSA